MGERPALSSIVLLMFIMAGWGVSASAQEADGTFNEIQKMIQNLEGRVGGLGETVPPETLESLEKQVEEAVRLLGSRDQENVLLRGKTSGLSSELDDMAAEREALNAKLSDVEADRDSKIADLEAKVEGAARDLDTAAKALEDERAVVAEKERELEKQHRNLEAVLAELAALNMSLEESEKKNKTNEQKIGKLDARLAEALAGKVEEMARYRSEFFGRLRRVLGERRDIRIVGDRFVFQSEVLFGSGEAVLGGGGMGQLEQFARTLGKVAATIPGDIDWVLRVDGHTDRIPIHNEQFASNWELSTARAVSVVKFLIDSGIPAQRLVAAGFGQFHPLDARDDEIGHRRNRRIEFKLTQK
ncbi:MAG: peptidoglycan -binding protein [Rhodospirillales bacterium]|jgi:chemotaxis protein MotB|nr:peptidoglycan -binding protein [Rhodospirillales bacterium]